MSTKRLRVRLKAADLDGLCRTFRSNITATGVFIKTAQALPIGTAVVVELQYVDSTKALGGSGVVAWTREEPSGSVTLAIDLAWDEESGAIVQEILRTPSPDGADRESIAPTPVDSMPPGEAPRLSMLARSFESAPPAPPAWSQPPYPSAVETLAPDPGLPLESLPDPGLPFDAASSGGVDPGLPLGGSEAPGPFEGDPGPSSVDVPFDALELPIEAPGAIEVPVATMEFPAADRAELEALYRARTSGVFDQVPEDDGAEPLELEPIAAGGAAEDIDLESMMFPAVEAQAEDPIPSAPMTEPPGPADALELMRFGEGEGIAIERHVPRAHEDSHPKIAPRRPGDLWETPLSSELPHVSNLPPRSALCVGIDLGTTNSCAAIVQDGKAKVVLSRRGTTTIPSVVALDSEGKVLVGDPALRQLAINPKNTIVGSKRLMGRDVHSPVVQEMKEHASYAIVEGPAGEAAVMVGEDLKQIEDIAALILKEIRESVSLNLKEEVNRAVITCPAYFQERQREAVRVAGERAGFHVERVLAEPTAAALNYALGRGLDRRKILVYDLGGGTFDVSLMEVEADIYEVLASGGDTFLGGLDFDDRLCRLLVAHVRQKHQLDPTTDQGAMNRLLVAAERAKRDLTDHNTTVVRLDYFVVGDANPVSLQIPVSREQIERFWEPLAERTIAACEDVCARAGITPDGVDDVILVGGQSRAPLVRKKVREFFGKEPRREVHPDEAVALGAAQYAHSLGSFDSLVLIDALPLSIGVGLPGGRFKKVVERDTKLPVTRTYHLRTTQEEQTVMRVVVFQGEQERAADNDLVGTLLLDGIPRGPRGAESIELIFELTGECILNLSARVESTGQNVKTRFTTKATPEEVLAALKEPPPERKRSGAGATAGALVKAEPPKERGFWAWLKRLFGFGPAKAA